MKKASFPLLIIFFVSVYLFLFSAFSASAFTIVSCETADNPNAPCNLCEALQMVSRSMRFALYIIIPGAAAFAFMIGGAFLLFAGGNENNIKTGQGIIRVVIYGILIAFGGFIIVNTIISELANPATFYWTTSWYQVPNCAEEGTPEMPTPAAPQANVSVGQGEAQQILFGTYDAKTAKLLLIGKGINIYDSTGRKNQTCEDLWSNPSNYNHCTATANMPKQTIEDLDNLNMTLKSELSRNTDIGAIGIQEEGDMHSPNTHHGDGYTVDLVDTINGEAKSISDDAKKYIIAHKEDLNIKRIGCTEGKAKGCDFTDPGSFHIEFCKKDDKCRK